MDASIAASRSASLATTGTGAKHSRSTSHQPVAVYSNAEKANILAGLKRGLDESQYTSHLTGHILWQDRLEKEYQAREKQLGKWYKKLGRSFREPVPDLRAEAGVQDTRTRHHGPSCSPQCVCDKFQSTPLTLRSSKSKVEPPCPGLLACSWSKTVPVAALSRWHSCEGPGGAHSGHGASAAMEQTKKIVTGKSAADMVAESDYQMMCRSLQRPKQLGGRTVGFARGGALGASAPQLTVQLTPALMACESPSTAVASLRIKEFLQGAAGEDPHGMKAALPLRDHEICSRQWRAANTGAFSNAMRASASGH